MDVSSINALFAASLRRHRAGKLAEAMAGYKQVLAQNPAHADALHLLGVTTHQSGGDRKNAEGLVRRAISIQPNSPEYHCNLALILMDMRRFPEAAVAFGVALQLRPQYAVVHNHLGNCLRAMGKLQESAASYRQAVAAKPDFFAAWSNLGNVLRELNYFRESETACRQAIALNPNFAPAHNNLGNALNKQDRVEEAIAEYRQALALDPKYAEVCSNLGNALKDLGRLDEGVATYRQALSINPNLPECQSNLIYDLHFSDTSDPAQILKESRDWAWRHGGAAWRTIRPHTNLAEANRRLVIGYVSPDFRQHAVASFFLPLLKNHDRTQFEVICYSNVRAPDSVTQQVRGLSAQWREIAAMPDDRAAELVRRDRVDILIDLAGHTAQNRLLLLAHRPAPVQITYLGYPGTTGLPAVDYKLTDFLADPPGMTESNYVESLLRLPKTAWCFEPVVSAPTVSPRPALRREGGAVCFGSFNNFAKITPRVLETWANILRAVPNSKLMIKAKALSAAGVREQVIQYFTERGIAAERLDMRARLLNPAEHLAIYNQIDIALDTFPYHGTTTTCEALWMGVPVLTLAGNEHRSRVGVSLLRNLGLEEFIAQSPDEYVQIAAKLAADFSKLSEMSANLRPRMQSSPLTDGPAFARDVEAQYRLAWRNWCDGTARQAGLLRAAEHFRRLSETHPDEVEIHFNLAAAQHFLGNMDQAIASLERARELAPQKAEILANLASTYQARNELEPALELFRQSIQLGGGSAEMHYNYAQALLLTGQFKEGWKEYENRLALTESMLPTAPLRAPRWEGEDLNGRTILLYGEQGLGDTIQFLRYVPEVVQRGGNVIVVVRKELEGLLQRNNLPGAQIISRLIIGSQPIDFHAPLLSLPLILGIDQPLPMRQPYISASTDSKWKEKLASTKSFKIGLAWAGNPHHKLDRDRSLPLTSFAPVADSGATFYSLQLGFGAEQVKQSPFPIIDWTAEITDIADTADLIAGLDLVVTVDTSVAHLAGAMGKETWILLPFAPDWRWMLDRMDCPWYPSVRLFRQSRRGDWAGVIAKARGALQEIVR